MFVFAYSVLAQLEYAFVPDVRLVLAKPWTHLVLDGSDCIDFDIALLDDCLDSSPSFYGALRACGFKCGYIDTGNPDHDIDHGDSSHGYLDQGCSTHRSRLPRHRHKGYHLARALLGFLYSPSIRDKTSSTTLPLRL
jgi:hypothetical protein